MIKGKGRLIENHWNREITYLRVLQQMCTTEDVTSERDANEIEHKLANRDGILL